MDLGDIVREIEASASLGSLGSEGITEPRGRNLGRSPLVAAADGVAGAMSAASTPSEPSEPAGEILENRGANPHLRNEQTGGMLDAIDRGIRKLESAGV